MNSLRGDSTRTEVCALMVATLFDIATHAGTDNQGVVGRGSTIKKHIAQQREAESKDENGALNLGGEISHLHKWDTP